MTSTSTEQPVAGAHSAETPYLWLSAPPIYRPGRALGFTSPSFQTHIVWQPAMEEEIKSALRLCLGLIPVARAISPRYMPLQELWAALNAALHCEYVLSGTLHVCVSEASEDPAQGSASGAWVSHSQPVSARLTDEVLVIVNQLCAGELAREELSESFLHLDERYGAAKSFGTNIPYLLHAADSLGAPVEFIPETRGLVRAGSGALQRLLRSTITDQSSSLGMTLATDKIMTTAALRSMGLPVADNRRVSSAEEATRAASDLGGPVVLKPTNRGRGEGVFSHLTTPAQVEAAFSQASELSDRLMVERWVPGHTHRFMVVGQDIFRVVKRLPGSVTGDGELSIGELAEASRKQAIKRGGKSGLIELDEEALELLSEQKLSVDTVLRAGQEAVLRRTDNVSRGGRSQDLDADSPSQVHPDNIALALEAARAVRLDVAGVDLLAEDISVSWLEGGVYVCEVNAAPQMSGARDASRYERYLRSLFPNGWSPPLEVWVVPSALADREQFLLDNVFAVLESERAAASWLSARTGLYREGKKSSASFDSFYEAAAVMLRRPTFDGGVSLITLEDVARFGLPSTDLTQLRICCADQFSDREKQLLSMIEPWTDAPVGHTELL